MTIQLNDDMKENDKFVAIPGVKMQVLNRFNGEPLQFNGNPVLQEGVTISPNEFGSVKIVFNPDVWASITEDDIVLSNYMLAVSTTGLNPVTIAMVNLSELASVYFDGRSYWVASLLENKMYKLTGNATPSVINGVSGRRFVFDGKRLWVSRESALIAYNTFINSYEENTKINSEVPIQKILFDGKNIYASDGLVFNFYFNKNGPFPIVIPMLDDYIAQSKTLSVDGKYLWGVKKLLGSGQQGVYKYNIETNKTTKVTTIPFSVVSTLFDGTYIWVLGKEEKKKGWNTKIVKLHPTSGAVLDSYTIYDRVPQQLICVGENIWVLTGKGTAGDFWTDNEFNHSYLRKIY